MRKCHECHTEISEEEICWDLFGGAYHPLCYVDAQPPHPGPGIDPEYLKAQDLLSRPNLKV